MNDIYYSVREIYKEISGKSENIDTEFNLALNLEIEQDMSLLKALSKIKIPKINSLLLSYVPEDWDECKEFIENAIEEINEFYFNDEWETNIESGQYIDSLRKVAQKTKRLFSVCCTSFTQTYFEMLISFSKHIEEIWLKGNTLSFDNEWNFGENMEGWKILHLDLSWSGDETKNDKNAKLKDFENLVKGIANCSQLRASLMTIWIKDWGYSTKEAQSILDKYGLDVVEVIS